MKGELTMSARTRSHLRNNVIGYVALFLALNGTAYAVVAVAPKNSVATKSIRNGAITAAKLRNGAVTTAKFAPSAVAPSARSASDAQRLGGTAPADFQHRVTGSCSGDETIQAIDASGTVTCVSPVHAIVMSPGFQQVVDQTVIANHLAMGVNCGAGGATIVAFGNTSESPATLNWFLSDGTTVSASGKSLGTTVPENEMDFSFDDKRVEGQFVFADATSVTTVNLHAFDGNAFGCEIRGTAEFAARS
jgi:hypothetical protein